MFERDVMQFVVRLAIAVGLTMPVTILGQEAGKSTNGERAKVSISFLPPPLETATYSLGIYEAKTHKLVRHLQEFSAGSAFTTGLNGLITSWDGKDDSGKAVPPGRYAARGYAVGALKVEGKAIHGNDWAGDDEGLRITRVQAIALVPEDNGLAIVGVTPLMHGEVARYGGEKCELLWQKLDQYPVVKSGEAIPEISLTAEDKAILAIGPTGGYAAYLIRDGVKADSPISTFMRGNDRASSSGKDSTTWKIEEGVLGQYSAQGERLRSLAPKDGEPIPIAVAASKTADKLYLLEESKDIQRVRGLSWKESTKEGDKAISTWTTFFENSIHPNFVPMGPDSLPLTTQGEIALVENPLSPGKPERLKLSATFDAKGSYLATADGLRLRQISQRPNLRAVKLAKNKATNALAFYQYDGAAWDEFAIEGAREMMSFDAGDIELTATGEKTPEKAAEPDL